MKYLILLTALAAIPAAAISIPANADTVRAAIGKPLQQAEALISRHDYQAALAEVAKARAIGHLTPFETMVAAQIDGIAAAGAGAYTQAAADYTTVLASSSVPPAARLQYTQAIAGFYDQAHDAPHTILWAGKYIAAGGADPRTRVLLAQAYYTQGDFPHAEQAAQRDEAAAGTLPQAELQLLASAADKAGDRPGYQAALRALLKAYPSPQGWNAAIAGVTASPGFPDRLTLDADRLRLATGTLTDPGNIEDYTERAILAGDPAEAHQAIEAGFASGALTAQTDSGHAARLRALAARQAATAPASPAAGDPDATLNLGIAFENAGNQAAAVQTFKAAISQPDSALAELWLIYAQGKAADSNRNGA